MRWALLVVALAILVVPSVTAYSHLYNITLTNDGTTLPRVNELIYIDLANVSTYYANRTDVILKNSSGSTIPFEYIKNSSRIAFIANLTSSNTTGYYLLSNDSSVSSYVNNQTFLFHYMTEPSDWGYSADTDFFMVYATQIGICR